MDVCFDEIRTFQVILGLASVLLRETISSFEEVESQVGERPSYVSETAIARLRDKLNGTDDTFGVQDVELQVCPRAALYRCTFAVTR